MGTICIMAKDLDVVGTCSALSCIADQYGYGLFGDIGNADRRSVAGIRRVMSHYQLNVLVSVTAPRDDRFRFSFGIIEEFYAYERNGLRPKFFDFISGVSELLHKRSEHFYLCFAGEWREGDKVFLVDGDLNEFLKILQRPGNVHTRLFSFGIDNYQDDDIVPLLARIHRVPVARPLGMPISRQDRADEECKAGR